MEFIYMLNLQGRDNFDDPFSPNKCLHGKKRHLNLFHVTLKLHEVRLILTRISPLFFLPTPLLQDQQKPFKQEGL